MQDSHARVKKDLEAMKAHLSEELALLHSTRATPALVEKISVSVYGQKMHLNQLASLSAPDARTIIVQPWDSSVLGELQRAIESSGLGMGIVAEEKFLRLTLPQLSQERRAEILKVLGRKTEDTRIAVRRVRDQGMKALEESFRKKEISEDEKFRSKSVLQKTIDECIDVIDSLETKKIKEIGGAQ